MMIKRLLALTLVSAATVALSGCMSFQTYGSPGRLHTISQGATRPEVLANMGEPDSIYRSNETEVFIYKTMRGANYLGVYSKITRKDTVVVMDTPGNVLSVLEVDAGRGWSLIAPAVLPQTYPVPPSELLEGPENYKADVNAK